MSKQDAKISYTLKPFIKDGSINIEFETVINDNIIDRTSRAIIDLKNKAVRESLIHMGWTPPCKTDDKDAINRVAEKKLSIAVEALREIYEYTDPLNGSSEWKCEEHERIALEAFEKIKGVK